MRIKNGFLVAGIGMMLAICNYGCASKQQPDANSPTSTTATTSGDADGDGVPDNMDKCPDKKEDGKAPDPKDGCPSP